MKIPSAKTDFILTAHRGGLYYRPENSIAAFEYSISLGVGWAECDIRLSKDLIPVLYHDDRLVFPTGKDKGIRELHQRDLASFDIGGGETIPTLRDVLTKFGDRLRFDLELKELDSVERVVNLVEELNLGNRVMLSSFIPEALQHARDIAPHVPRGLLVDRLTGRIVGGRSAIKAGEMFRCDFFLPHFNALSMEWISAAQESGMKVVPWTVNKIDDGKRLIDNGVDGLISDRPDQFFPLISYL